MSFISLNHRNKPKTKMKTAKKYKMVNVFFKRQSDGSMDAMVMERKTGKIIIPFKNEWLTYADIKTMNLHVVEKHYD